jgi:hypothetical protein
MGTMERFATIQGRTLQEAFKELQNEDESEYGQDIYSGRWNNCQGVREVSPSEFDKRYAESDISKHEVAIAKCVQKPIGNTNKVKTQVTNYPNKGARKWVTKYVAETWDRGIIVEEESQTEAIKKARLYVDKHPDVTLTVHITKKLVSSPTKVAVIGYKPAKNERDGVWEIFGAMSY